MASHCAIYQRSTALNLGSSTITLTDIGAAEVVHDALLCLGLFTHLASLLLRLLNCQSDRGNTLAPTSPFHPLQVSGSEGKLRLIVKNE